MYSFTSQALVRLIFRRLQCTVVTYLSNNGVYFYFANGFVDNGRTALRKSNKFNVLYQFSVRCPEDQVYNSTMSKLCTVINVCQEKLLLLPLVSTQSAHAFGLGDINLNDSGKLKFVIGTTNRF